MWRQADDGLRRPVKMDEPAAVIVHVYGRKFGGESIKRPHQQQTKYRDYTCPEYNRPQQPGNQPKRIVMKTFIEEIFDPKMALANIHLVISQKVFNYSW